MDLNRPTFGGRIDHPDNGDAAQTVLDRSFKDCCKRLALLIDELDRQERKSPHPHRVGGALRDQTAGRHTEGDTDRGKRRFTEDIPRVDQNLAAWGWLGVTPSLKGDQNTCQDDGLASPAKALGTFPRISQRSKPASSVGSATVFISLILLTRWA